MALTEQEQRTARNFISTLSSAFGMEQSYADTDSYAVNQPRQYTVIGPNGTQIEGASARLMGGGGIVLSSPLVMLALGASLVYLFIKKT